VIAEGFNEAGLAVLRDGRLLAALRKSPGPDCDSLSLASSTDGGYTWSPPQPVTAPGEHPGDLVPLRNGSILLTYGVRHDPGQPFTGYDRNRQVVHQMGVAARMSEDGGRTWSPPMALAQDAPNYDCGYPSSVELEEGRILTLYYRVKGEADYDLAGAETRLVLWRIGSGRPVIQESAAD
jgi:hypothetical protein